MNDKNSRFDFQTLEQKWQRRWSENRTFAAQNDSPRPKYYALNMFPYPSGSGLHIGHIASYMPTDVVARYKRAKGYNVLNPMGWDAFGLPAEQYAIQTGIHPEETTRKAIENFRRQLLSFGFSFDWEREVSTCSPDYYKWTQYIFTVLHERGLTYQKEVPVNWCPALRTVLANEEVVDGKSERGGHPVQRIPMKQWMLKITAYADRLIDDLDTIDWPERAKESQRQWIGRSQGARVRFPVSNTPNLHIDVYTTRPDTIFGATFLVLAPEHPLVESLTHSENRSRVQAYVESSQRKLEVDRKAAHEKTGVFTGSHALHPLTGRKIPVWIADYVLMDYGTGAIMAVPAHDERDFEFARAHELEIIRVVESEQALPYEGDGLLINSQFLDGLSKNEAIAKAIDVMVEKGTAERQIQYKLRDWLFSRQRYWGEPFPVVRMSDGHLRCLPADELPVLLPAVADYEPSSSGEPPLARNTEWMRYRDPKTGAEGTREADTMPGSAGSSWYFLRYCDPRNDREFCSKPAQNYWMPVDLYVGGPEHCVGHLLYARFWQKVLFDAGLVSHPEPFRRLAHQSIMLGPDGQRMSKSRGNVIQPDDVRVQYGADVVRTFILFLGPMGREVVWNSASIEGVQRFLERLWRLVIDESGDLAVNDAPAPEDVVRWVHKTIRKVENDIEGMSLNTAISAQMILLNEVYRHGCRSRAVVRPMIQLVAPFAPHLAEELWEKLGEEGLVADAAWPSYDPNLAADSLVTIGVQVKGRLRGEVQATIDATEADVVEKALEIPSVKNALNGKKPMKIIYKPGKILNLIAPD